MQQQEEMQEPPQIRSAPYQSPMYNYGSSIVIMTDPGSELYQLELTLRGLREKGDGTFEKIGKPKMNDEGINSVISLVSRCLMTRNTVFSNLKEEDVRNTLYYVADGLAKDLMLNRAYYGIKNNSEKSLLYQSIITYIYITLKRSQDEGEKRFWKGSVQEIKTSTNNEGQRKGFFARLGW